MAFEYELYNFACDSLCLSLTNKQMEVLSYICFSYGVVSDRLLDSSVPAVLYECDDDDGDDDDSLPEGRLIGFYAIWR